MGKSYSTDLRERVLQAIEEGMSKAQAHRTFHITRSTIDHWFALRERTGGLTPPPHRSSRTRQLEGQEFEAFAHRHRHATLGEMAQAWQHEKGTLLSAMSFSRALSAIGWTRKKRVGVTKSVTKSNGQRGSKRLKS
jgi:transposase